MGMFELIKILAESETDYVLVASSIPFEWLRRDADMLEVGTYRIPVASIDHLIAMKSASGRSKDRIDIEALQKLRAGEQP